MRLVFNHHGFLFRVSGIGNLSQLLKKYIPKVYINFGLAASSKQVQQRRSGARFRGKSSHFQLSDIVGPNWYLEFWKSRPYTGKAQDSPRTSAIAPTTCEVRSTLPSFVPWPSVLPPLLL